MMIEPRARKLRLHTRDLLTEAEPPESELNFNPETEIPAEVWQLIDELLQLEHPLSEASSQAALLPLVQFDRTRVRQVREKPGLEDGLVRQLHQEYQTNFPRIRSLSSAILLSHMADFLPVFPDLIQRIETVFEWKVDDHFMNVHAGRVILDPNADPSHDNIIVKTKRVRSLMQMLPQRHPSLVEFAERAQIWELGWTELKRILTGPSPFATHAPQLASDLALIFPEKKQEILELIQPKWEDIKERILRGLVRSVDQLGNKAVVTDAFARFTNNTMGLTLLAAQQVRFTPTGQLEIIPRQRRIQKERPPLPVRSS